MIEPSHVIFGSFVLWCSWVASSFVPRADSAIVAPMPKAVRELANVQLHTSTAHSNKHDLKMMPIGVPKVAYRVPGSQGADW